jgi:hypothetical protein
MDDNLHPWQQQIFDRIVSGGVKPEEMICMTAGRNVGKSIMNQQAIDRLMRDLNSRPIEELVLSEGRVYGARYHCVEPIGGNWRKMEDWCIRTYGSRSGSIWADKTTPEPGERWYANNRKFWFRNERDRTMFIMRWSGS